MLEESGCLGLQSKMGVKLHLKLNTASKLAIVVY